MTILKVIVGVLAALALWNYPLQILAGFGILIAVYLVLAVVAWLVRTLLNTHPK